MDTKIIIAPTEEPISLAEVKVQQRLDPLQTAEDAWLTLCITAAREQAEARTGRALCTQTLEFALDAFPDGAIQIRKVPMASVVSIKYLDVSGAEQTIANTNYGLDTYGELVHWVIPAATYPWPDTQTAANAVKVRYVAGYGSAAQVPSSLRQWMLLAVGDLYLNRERSAERPTVPHGFADSLLRAYKTSWL